jgi:hypothetical protein
MRRTPGPHHVIADFDYGLKHGELEPDEWLDYTVPDNPFTIFMSSYHHTGDLLADHGKDSGGHLLNRMVFSHQVTALEAYQLKCCRRDVCVSSQIGNGRVRL